MKKPISTRLNPPKGSAAHFIEWHNKNATASNYLSPAWVKRYFEDVENSED